MPAEIFFHPVETERDYDEAVRMRAWRIAHELVADPVICDRFAGAIYNGLKDGLLNGARNPGLVLRLDGRAGPDELKASIAVLQGRLKATA